MQANYYKIVLIDSITGSTGNYAVLDTEGIDLSNTFQVSDVADISKRKDAISNTIDFKATKNNNIIFGNLSNLNRVVDDSVNLSFLFNFNITQDIDCQVYENSTLIFTGKLHFIACNRDKDGNLTYQCSIKGYAVDYFSKINDLLISNLDFSSFNHTYNIDAISKSWSNQYYKNGVLVNGTPSDGYKYPLIDYGENVTNETKFDNQFDYRNFRPAFTLKEYFNAMFTQSGLTGNYRYTVTGNTAFLDEFNKVIIPNNDGDFSFAKDAQIIFEVAKTANPLSYNGNNQTFHDSTNNRTEYNHLINFDTTVVGGTGQNIISTNVINGQRIVFNNLVNTTVSASVSFTSGQLAPYDLTARFICLYRDKSTDQFNNIADAAITYPYTAVHDSQQNNGAKTLSLTVSQNFNAGSEIAFVVMLETSATYFGGLAVSIVNADCKIGSTTSTSQVTINLGNPAILVAQNFQSVKQSDFLKSVIQTFNLMVFPDPEDSRHIIFMPYNDYYSNFTSDKIVGSALDWTDKIDNATFSITPIADVFNLYKFVYKDDTDFYSKYYKDLYGETYGNTTLTGTTNGQDKSIEVIWGSTPVPSYSGRTIPWLWELDTNNLKKKKTTVPRMLFWNGLKPCSQFEIGRMSLSASTQTYYFSSIDSAHVSQYTFNQYPEANEFTLSADNEFCNLTFGNPKQVFYTSGGITQTYGSGKQNLYDRFYSDQIAELTDSNTRIIETTAYLNEIDIQSLNFQNPIYFNSVLGHNYFKLLSVEYSNKNEPSNIKLQTAFIQDAKSTFQGYKNSTQAAFIQKNNCGAPLAGEAIYYLVPQNRYTSYISPDDANAQALHEISTSGQSYANTYGICVNTGSTYTMGFADNPKGANPATSSFTGVFMTDNGTLNINSTLFGYADGFKPTREVSQYYSNGTNYWHTNTSSVIDASGSTSSLSGITYDCYFAEAATKPLSCSLSYTPSNMVNYKISDPYPNVGTVVRNGANTSSVTDGWYADSSNAYHVVSGVITQVATCGAQTSS